MASAIGTALFCSVLHPMLAMVKDRGLAIVRSMADKAGDKAVDKVMDTPMDRAMAMVVDKGDGIVNIERDISNLQITLRMIESIIRVAEEKQIDDGFIQNWLRDLVDIAYEARDVLDDFITFSSCVITAEESSNPEITKIIVCPQLQSLPPDFHKLSSLSRLEIQNCNGLKRLQLDALVSLKDLDISSCESLVQITSAICESLEISYCRLLEKMDVARCDSLQVVIKILMLEGCESLRSLSIDIHGLDSLEHLRINHCPTLELAFEDGSSSSSSSGNSVAVPLHYISTDNTQVFRTILLHHELVYLESLDIRNLGGFENFDETEANNFCKSRSLKSLEISHCKDLKSLPVDFHKLSSLESLSIDHCPQLQSLPPDFHKLSSLVSFSIFSCPQLQSLSPDFHKLLSLKKLCINDCPLLYERCKDESVLDWYKINHIREREILQHW